MRSSSYASREIVKALDYLCLSAAVLAFGVALGLIGALTPGNHFLRISAAAMLVGVASVVLNRASLVCDSGLYVDTDFCFADMFIYPFATCVILAPVAVPVLAVLIILQAVRLTRAYRRVAAR